MKKNILLFALCLVLGTLNAQKTFHFRTGHPQGINVESSSFVEGLPNIPFENRYIAVPQGATARIEVTEKGHETLNDIDLLLAAEVIENAAVGLPKLRKDMSVFGLDANFPSENVRIAQTTQIRGLDVVLLNIINTLEILGVRIFFYFCAQ